MKQQAALRKRVWLRRLAMFLIFWQLGVIALAIVAPYFLGGAPLERFVVSEHPTIQELIDPRFSDRSDLLREIQEHRLEHIKYLERFHRELRCLYESRDGSPNLAADSTQRQWWHACGESGYIGRHREWAAVGIDPGRYAWYTTEAQRWLDAAEDYKGYQSSSWQMSINNVRLLLHVGQGEYLKASQCVVRESNRYAGRPDPLSEVLATIAADPDSFRAFMDMINALAGSSHFFHAGIARRDLLWKAYDRASTDAERIEASLALAALLDDWRRDPDNSVGYSLYSLCARLACRDPNLTDELSRALAGLAGFAGKRGETSAAISLYAAVTDQLPGTASWGVAVFNRGYLLRESGRHAACMKALEPIFGSGVNDFEPGPHLMEAYRNYRHRSARLVANSYKDMCNYPMAWWWQWRAVKAYPYRSWCGTCSAEQGRRSFYRLMKSSAAAGPLVFGVNGISSPLRNWRIWFALGVSFSIWRRVRRWRARKNLR